MRKKLFYITAALLLLFTCSSYVNAQETAMSKENLNIVFAVDHSGSMNIQDTKRMIPQMLEVFADTMHSENICIGYVAYNDTVIARRAPMPVRTAEQRDLLKEIMGNADNHGETDIGLGLQEAYHLMDGYSGRKLIVLISDGETDLGNSSTGRTEEDSAKDVEEVIRMCREEDISVITVAFGEDYEGEKTQLKNISDQTGGESYAARRPEDLIGILYELFHTNFSYTVYAAGDSVYGQGRQKMAYDVGKGSYDELTVLLLSDKGIKDAEVLCGEKVMQPDIMGNYAVAGLLDVSGEISVHFETEQGQKMSVFMIGRRDIIPTVEWSGDIYKNRPTNFKIYFTDGEGRQIEDEEYYEAFEWRAEFQEVSSGVSIPVTLGKEKGGLGGNVVFSSSGKYRLYLDTGRNAENNYGISEVTVLNTLPDYLPADAIELLTVSEGMMVDLRNYFGDADGDELTYELQGLPEKAVSARIEGHFLHVFPRKRGTGDIILLVSDGEGSLMGHIPVQVKSLPEAYWQVVFLAICLILFGAWKIYRKKKKLVVIPDSAIEKNSNYFTGRLNAYFTLVPEGMEEIPPFAFALHHIREKKIVLGDMFKDYAELVDLLGLDQVYLFPAENRKIIFYHNCDSTVMIGSSIVCRKMQYAVGYGNVIYVTSQDGTCELEVHYISMI